MGSIYARRNLESIGPARTGKTHLAMAFGYECCQHGMKTYFIKASELRDKFTNARRLGKEASTLTALARPSCLIIDEVGYCEFDKENTRLFFDMVDRRYNKEGAFNLVFTSNKTPSRGRIISRRAMPCCARLTESLMTCWSATCVAKKAFEGNGWRTLHCRLEPHVLHVCGSSSFLRDNAYLSRWLYLFDFGVVIFSRFDMAKISLH